ncbi:hypothetical protein ROHU_027904 [Labeo rohita]|uniref:Uncharacterized protein n=1 Tax=Labeo rohita TaxID=84645 RepID=A0A498M8T8_LABRO|nr:hypothetical protein ROHU_027904 [Labeo rohita]
MPPYTEGATFVQGSPSQLCSERRDGARSNLQFSTSAVRGRWSQARASVKRAAVLFRASVRDRPPPKRDGRSGPESAGGDAAFHNRKQMRAKDRKSSQTVTKETYGTSVDVFVVACRHCTGKVHLEETRVTRAADERQHYALY